MSDRPSSLSKTTRILHWVIALTIIGLLAMGVYMAETGSYFLYDWHKSIGVLILGVAAIRVGWRFKEGWPKPVAKLTGLQHKLLKTTHWSLLGATLLFPISGMMMSGAGGHGISIFGLQLLAENNDPITGKAVPLSETVASVGHLLHSVLIWVVVAFLVLHIAGALKHHFVDKDRTILRMIGR